MGENDQEILLKCFDLANKCPKSNSAFSVGAILYDKENDTYYTGFSREIDDMHAEQVAISKALKHTSDLSNFSIYSSLEPCGERKSFPLSCCELIIKHRISKVIYGASEPNYFVNPCGKKILLENKVKVKKIKNFEDKFVEQNHHIIKNID